MHPDRTGSSRIVPFLLPLLFSAVFAHAPEVHAQGMWDFTAFPEGMALRHNPEGARSVWSTPQGDPKLQRPLSLAGGALALAPSGDGLLYQSWFYPTVYEGRNEIKWMGFLFGLFVDARGNLREDTDGDGRLVLEQDAIVKVKVDPATDTVGVERFVDANGDGIPDAPIPTEKSDLRAMKGVWEAGHRLAFTEPAERTLWTWIDRNYDELVGDEEVIDFTVANAKVLTPYLQTGGGLTPATLIKFIRGEAVTGLRDRQVSLAEEQGMGKHIWKLGDIVHSTPTVVGTPRERYDVLYGDASYTPFYTRYRKRRQVIYAGANDGMLHAFNGGFYHRGDDPATPAREHGWVTRTPDDNMAGPALGDELWGYVPYQLLPHLQWLASRDYTHVYYVDLKPKVTDARIFAADEDHPNGWGTILIGGFRFGGACGACMAGNGAPPWSIRDDFNGDGDRTDIEDNRTFYTAYFALDITNPDKPPVLLWSFSDIDLGLTTSYPAIVRASPKGRPKADPTEARWFMVVGSGPTGYDQDSSQSGMLFAVDLKSGPTEANIESALVTVFPTDERNASLRDPTAVDVDLDYRVDALFVGAVIHPWHQRKEPWTGKMYRLSTARGDPNPEHWGLGASETRMPGVLLGSIGNREDVLAGGAEDVISLLDPNSTNLNSTKPPAKPELIGPVMGAPVVTIDERNHVWVLFGTGRYASALETDALVQRVIGVKDPVLSSGCQEMTPTSCETHKLLNVSGADVCPECRKGQVNGVAGAVMLLGPQTASVEMLVQQGDGWMLSLPESGEAALTGASLIGGTLFVPTVTPHDKNSDRDKGAIYALYYLTGTAFKDPIVGTEIGAAGMAARRAVMLGDVGAPLRVGIHLGDQGSRGIGQEEGGGCQGRTTGFMQSSAGVLGGLCTKPALPVASRFISWQVVRD